jgi:hypothetical protein
MAGSRAALVLVFVIGLSGIAHAQTTATLVGVVLDATGAALAGASVTAVHLETTAERRAVTSGEGRFALSGLPPGDYDLRVELKGFRPLVQRGVRLSVGEHPALALTMQVGAEESVTVSAASPVNSRTAELSYLVDRLTIEQIPINGRNFTDLMSLQPAVSPFAHRDNGSVVAHGLAMSVNGQDPRANVYLLDGTLLNDFTNGPAGSAAGTALGMDTVREFRVESNTYSAEFGRAAGGQINVITRSGTNQPGGSAFEFHRNETLEARNYFDAGAKPDFSRHQFGATFGGPLRRDRVFLFTGYEALIEDLGRTIVTTVPDDDAREGRLPGGLVVPIHPGVLPYVQAFPRANGESLGGGLARHTFPFAQTLDQHFVQMRVDARLGGRAEVFARYTLDDASQRLPTDYPQFPRAFISTNQFLTTEFRQVLSASSLHTARLGYSRTRIGQNVEANTAAPLPVFVPGRDLVGAIDIGGFPRFGPQSSANVRLRQDVISGQYDLTHARGRHLVKVGGLVERYIDDEFNPTFSLGIFRFASLERFLRNLPASFIGLTPAGDTTRHWNWTLYAAYLQEELRARPNLTLNLGLRVEGATLPRDRGNRDINMPDLLATAPTVGPLYDNPGASWSPRLGGVWDVGGRGRTAVRGGYGLYYTTSNQQNLIVTVTNPPATPRVVIANPTFPVPPFERAAGISVRPIQFDVELPRVHMWNANVQRAFWRDWNLTVGYAGSRGRRLWRNSDRNVPTPTTREDGTPFYPLGVVRPNPNFSAIEVKSSDGDSWYRALIVDVRRRWSGGWQVQSSYTWSRSEDTTQNSTFFSDSTTATTSAMPEFIAGYNKGLSDFHAEHNWVINGVWELPGRAGTGAAAVLRGWRIAGVLRVRSGNPLTPFLQTNRSRSLWSPSLGPGTGPDRPSYAPGRGPQNAVLGRPDQWFDPTAFALPEAGTFGNVGRNELIGPDLRTLDLALSRQLALPALGPRVLLDIRLELFNVLNRANFGPPSLVAFSGAADGEAILPAFGQIRSTATAARQAQIGARLVF